MRTPGKCKVRVILESLSAEDRDAIVGALMDLPLGRVRRIFCDAGFPVSHGALSMHRGGVCICDERGDVSWGQRPMV